MPGYTGDGDYDLRILMAISQREMGNSKLALKYFDECIRDHEKNNTVGLFDYLHRGVTLLNMHKYPGALVDLKKEIKVYDKLADAHYYLGLIYLRMNDVKNAGKSFNRAKELYIKTGYHRNDPYKEEPDQVYLSDITEAIAKL
jgi:tetratricopeptide (TPR) repeat protein